MSMSWLIIVFILNGVPTLTEDFQPKLVPSAKCQEMQQGIAQLMFTLFPNTEGVVFCVPAASETEVPDVEA